MTGIKANWHSPINVKFAIPNLSPDYKVMPIRYKQLIISYKL